MTLKWTWYAMPLEDRRDIILFIKGYKFWIKRCIDHKFDLPMSRYNNNEGCIAAAKTYAVSAATLLRENRRYKFADILDRCADNLTILN
jgi:hypothetical protein